MAQPVVAADTDAQTMAAAGSKSLESHLVDFGMPTPGHAERRGGGGLERWNKAILVGSSRLHSILSTDSVGTKARLYRAPDGRSGRCSRPCPGRPSPSRPAGYGCPARRWIPGRRCTRTESAHRSAFFRRQCLSRRLRRGDALPARVRRGSPRAIRPRRPIGSSSSRCPEAACRARRR